MDWPQILFLLLALIGGGGAVEAINQWAEDFAPDGTAWAIVILGGALLLGLIGSYRQQAKLDALEAPKRMPTNRNELVAAISVLETCARDVIGAALTLNSQRVWTNPKISNEVLRLIQESHRQDKERLSQGLRAAQESYGQAKNNFTKELRIAGEDFRRRLRLHPHAIDTEVGKCLYDKDEEVASESLHKISQATEEILSAIDEGRAYYPAKSR